MYSCPIFAVAQKHKNRYLTLNVGDSPRVEYYLYCVQGIANSLVLVEAQERYLMQICRILQNTLVADKTVHLFLFAPGRSGPRPFLDMRSTPAHSFRRLVLFWF